MADMYIPDPRAGIEETLDEPMPWIGMYIAAASAICTIAMAADAFRGFKTKKLWFPCKYFSLNATSLTLLAVAMKLTVDLSSAKLGVNDETATFSSLVLMCIAIANFMTSLASMDDNGVMVNLTALGILIVTVAVNMCLYNIQLTKAGHGVGWLVIFAIAMMFLLLVLSCSLAITVPTTKRYIEFKFQEMHKMVSKERMENENLTTVLKKYWLMAETGDPQFVMARSAICVIPGVICFLMASFLVVVYIPYDQYTKALETETSYKWSINWILVVQTGGVGIGIIAPISRWFIAARFWNSRTSHRNFREELKIATYWTQTLVAWRETPIPSRIRNLKCKKVIHVSKTLLLMACIGIQSMIILASKLVLVFSAWFIAMVVMFFRHIKKLIVHVFRLSNNKRELEWELDFSLYVLLLEGEVKLPNRTVENMCKEVDKLVEVGKMKRPKNLIQLLQKSENFNGVIEFDNNEVASRHSFQEPPNCWSLVLANLTRIAISLPNIPDHSANQLFNGVSEGLSFVKQIEKTIDTNGGELISIRKAAKIVWGRLELSQDRAHKYKLQNLLDIAKKTIEDFKGNTNKTDMVMKNPLNWPPEVIAANSMYRICQTILLTEFTSDEHIFERLSIIISDILGACLTNLVHVLMMKCQSNAIEERQENIRKAAILLGKSKDVIQFLEQRELPSLTPEKAGYIDAWRAILKRDRDNHATPDRTLIRESSNGNVSVEIES